MLNDKDPLKDKKEEEATSGNGSKSRSGDGVFITIGVVIVLVLASAFALYKVRQLSQNCQRRLSDALPLGGENPRPSVASELYMRDSWNVSISS